MPKVLNQRHNPEGPAIYIGRPTKWGNPFIVGRDGTREEVIQLYRNHLECRPDLVADAKKELKGMNLICWCAPEACHGDVLIEIANKD